MRRVILIKHRFTIGIGVGDEDSASSLEIRDMIAQYLAANPRFKRHEVNILRNARTVPDDSKLPQDPNGHGDSSYL